MTRRFLIGALSLSLAACGRPYAPIAGTPNPGGPDLPDAALVQPCDTANADPANNLALSFEVSHVRHQRDDCAARMAGVATWRADALKRAAKP